jgi:3'-phosphoadenosine 5'-phosphosulfate sulfotransferase
MQAAPGRAYGRPVAAAHTYVVECYSPGVDREAVALTGDRATSAAAELSRQGRPVEYVGALLFPQDEIVFHLFRASGPDAVREASRGARVEFERVVESVPVGIESFAERVR